MNSQKKKRIKSVKLRFNYIWSFVFLFALVLVLTGIYVLYQEYKLISLENEPQFISSSSEIRPLSQLWGSIDKEMFMDISNPEFVLPEQADKFLKSTDLVYFIRTKQTIFVYPQMIVRFHEVVNQVINGQPVAITYCILSNTPLAYERKLQGQVDSFQSLGPLMYGNQVMYDKLTNSYWNELTGVSFAGKLKGQRLHQVMVVENTTWNKIKNLSNLKVLKPVEDVGVYRQNEGENNQDVRVNIGLTSMMQQKPDSRFAPGRFGYGVFIHNVAKFYPSDEVVKHGLIADDVAGWHLIIVNDPFFGDQRMFRSYLNGRDLSFSFDGQYLHDKQTGSTWDLTGLAISGSMQGAHLSTPAYESAYWYSWSAFYPQTIYYQ